MRQLRANNTVPLCYDLCIFAFTGSLCGIGIVALRRSNPGNFTGDDIHSNPGSTNGYT